MWLVGTLPLSTKINCFRHHRICYWRALLKREGPLGSGGSDTKSFPDDRAFELELKDEGKSGGGEVGGKAGKHARQGNSTHKSLCREGTM